MKLFEAWGGEKTGAQSPQKLVAVPIGVYDPSTASLKRPPTCALENSERFNTVADRIQHSSPYKRKLIKPCAVLKKPAPFLKKKKLKKYTGAWIDEIMRSLNVLAPSSDLLRPVDKSLLYLQMPPEACSDGNKSLGQGAASSQSSYQLPKSTTRLIQLAKSRALPVAKTADPHGWPTIHAMAVLRGFSLPGYNQNITTSQQSRTIRKRSDHKRRKDGSGGVEIKYSYLPESLLRGTFTTLKVIPLNTGLEILDKEEEMEKGEANGFVTLRDLEQTLKTKTWGSQAIIFPENCSTNEGFFDDTIVMPNGGGYKLTKSQELSERRKFSDKYIPTDGTVKVPRGGRSRDDPFPHPFPWITSL